MHLLSPTQTMRTIYRRCVLIAIASALVLCAHLIRLPHVSAQQNQPAPKPAAASAATPHRALNTRNESPEQAAAASVGCITCHVGIEHTNMHAEDTVVLGCADCHGGDATIQIAGTKDSA